MSETSFLLFRKNWFVCYLLKRWVIQMKRYLNDVGPSSASTTCTQHLLIPRRQVSRMLFTWQLLVITQRHRSPLASWVLSQGMTATEDNCLLGCIIPEAGTYSTSAPISFCTFPGATGADYITLSPVAWHHEVTWPICEKDFEGKWAEVYNALILVWTPWWQYFVLFVAVFTVWSTQLDVKSTRELRIWMSPW